MTDAIRTMIRKQTFASEGPLLAGLVRSADLSAVDRARIAARAADLVNKVRTTTTPTLMESFLGEYGLSTQEGIALMCLAEALLRVPDSETIDDLIADKITASDWDAHSGRASSTLVNASTWALMFTGRVLNDRQDRSIAATLQSLVRRVGEPVVRTAVAQAMKELGRQFVLGQTIEAALKEEKRAEKQGYTHSYDMLGEGARTDADARRYHLSYAEAITEIAKHAHGSVQENPGISVKLSALHPRYEARQKPLMFDTLVARIRSLAALAAASNIGLNIDAEEANRLDISLDVIEAVLSDPALKGWDGFGIVVQAYGRRAAPTLDWLHALAGQLDRKIMVRLVKGAYWDTEIKHAQVEGHPGYPVFTRKLSTDISYIACARKLLDMTDRVYPQFATHNAHTVAAILEMAGDRTAFEFQRLHGMGEALHDTAHRAEKTRCRIYAPVGAHRDLLAYLVRRLLENGANSSFVHQIVDASVPAEKIATDPFAAFEALATAENPLIPAPSAVFAPRSNSQGWDIDDPQQLADIESARRRFRTTDWTATALLAQKSDPGPGRAITNPANPADFVGTCHDSTNSEVEAALASASTTTWASVTTEARAQILEKAADLYEQNFGEIFALLTREAGKTLPDCVAELREAVDFLRYYASEARGLIQPPCGVFVCISPWNFPLAIFTGQIAASLAAGNATLAKPAEQTPLIAHFATKLLHKAGIPTDALQLLPGDGSTVGAMLTTDPRVGGICFTGSTETAQIINRAMAANLAPDAPLIAETGGLNAMIVDSTALPEQAIRDIIAASFQSAGQRCSALRMLYLQEDIAPRFLTMLTGAMNALSIGDPWEVSTDVGPVIDAEACSGIARHLAAHKARHALSAPKTGHFVAPTLIDLPGIAALEREIFGPVLHVTTFKSRNLDRVIDDINARGFGLTFGLHTRLDDRVQHVVDRLHAGNIYVNRNQIGAIVGSQPFGGEGLSGTGPKAGGPHYLSRFTRSANAVEATPEPKLNAKALTQALSGLDATRWQALPDRIAVLSKSVPDHPALSAAALPQNLTLPGPTGERNILSLHARGPALCLGPRPETALSQALQSLAAGNPTIVFAPACAAIDALQKSGAPLVRLESLPVPEALTSTSLLAVVAFAGDLVIARAYRQALAARQGPILPFVASPISPTFYMQERHVCTDTTAAGGNAALLAGT